MKNFRYFSVSLKLVLLFSLLAGSFSSASAQDAIPQATLLIPEDTEVVPDQYIVVYKPGYLRVEESGAAGGGLGDDQQHGGPC